MKACAYEGCDLLVMRSDTYLDWRGIERTDGFCDRHWKEHLTDLMNAEEVEKGKPWTSRAKPRQEREEREVKPCGTTAAYQRHMRAGDEPCEPCLAAIRVQNAARRAIRKGGTAA